MDEPKIGSNWGLHLTKLNFVNVSDISIHRGEKTIGRLDHKKNGFYFRPNGVPGIGPKGKLVFIDDILYFTVLNVSGKLSILVLVEYLPKCGTVSLLNIGTFDLENITNTWDWINSTNETIWNLQIAASSAKDKRLIEDNFEFIKSLALDQILPDYKPGISNNEYITRIMGYLSRPYYKAILTVLKNLR